MFFADSFSNSFRVLNTKCKFLQNVCMCAYENGNYFIQRARDCTILSFKEKCV